MKNEEKDLKKENKIEYIVTAGTLLFIGLLSIFSIRGCENNTIDLNATSNTLSKNNYLASETVPKKESINEIKVRKVVDKAPTKKTELEAQRVMVENRAKEVARVKANTEAKRIADEESARKRELEAQRVMEENRAKEVARVKANTEAKRIADEESTRKRELEAQKIIAPNTLVNIDEQKEEEGILNDIKMSKVSSVPYILKGIHFKTASSSLSDKSQRQLNVIYNALKVHSNIKIRLRGHTDNRGSNALNLKLSKNRALSVKTFLVNSGISSNKISVEGRASLNAIASNDTEEGRLNNRRVDIAVIK